MEKLGKALEEAKDPAEIKRRWRQYQAIDQTTMFHSLDVWVADIRYLMDEFESINSGADVGVAGPTKQFAGRLDLSRLGILGMSFGGAAAGEICTRDSRCKAGLNLDGWQYGDVVDHPLPVPFLYFSSDGNDVNAAIYEDSRADLYSVHVNRSAHLNFSDMSLAVPAFRWIASSGLSLLGRVDGAEMEHIMSAYTLAFFQQYLQGRPSLCRMDCRRLGSSPTSSSPRARHLPRRPGPPQRLVGQGMAAANKTTKIPPAVPPVVWS